MDTEHRTKIIIRSIMCVLGIIGNNWLLISSLPKSISQIKTKEILFINLAVSNLITNYIVDFLNIFHNEHYLPVGKVFCGFRFFLPELSETSSTLSTLFITVYWYQKLVGSLKRGGAPVQMDSLRFVILLLTGCWIFSFVFNLPHFFFIVEDSGNMTAEECREELPSPEAEKAYESIYVILANVIPLAGIFYTGIQIMITLLKSEKRMRKTSAVVKNEEITSDEKSEDNTNNNSAVKQPKSQAKSGSLLRVVKSVLAVAILFLFCWVIHLTVIMISSVYQSRILEDIESFIGASYTCSIPYIYLYGVQKLTCSGMCNRT